MFSWPFWGSGNRKSNASQNSSYDGELLIRPHLSQRATRRNYASTATNYPGQEGLSLVESAMLSLQSREKIPLRRLLDPKSPRLTTEERRRISQSLSVYSTMMDQALTANWEPGRPLIWPSGLDDSQLRSPPFRSEANPRKLVHSSQSLSGAPSTKIVGTDGGLDKTPAAFVPKHNKYFAHPIEDRTEEFFDRQFRRLYERIEEYTISNYCLFSITIEKPSDSLWGLSFPPQFVAYAKMVAEPDSNVGGWDRLLADKEQRKWMIMGIIARVLEAKVFSVLLFGGDEHQTKLLQTIDTTLVVSEGFARTELRAKAIRIALGDQAVSPFFYQSVAALSQQIWDLLAQLYVENDAANKVYLSTTRPTPANTFPSMVESLQAINDFVADAAYLSICIRLSPEIILFHADLPGNPYNSDLHDSIDNVIYQNSKAAAAAAAKRAHDAASDVFQQTPVYRAMTQIAVWPRIERYKPGDGTEVGCKDGFRIYKICNAQVVCYWGLENRNEKEKQNEDLVEFAATKRKIANQGVSRQNFGLASTAARLGIAATAIGVLFLLR